MKTILTYIITCSLSIFTLNAQTFNFSGTDNGSMICSSESVDLRSEPGTKSDLITLIYFGEEVEKLGEEAYVKNEDRSYIRVRGADGNIGWVNDAFFVSEGGVAATVRQSRIYRRPNTLSTATMEFFEPGEVVILVDNSNQWVNLVSKGKTKQGWVNGLDNISIEGDDIEIATLYQLTMQEQNLQNRKEKLTQLWNIAEDSRSDLSDLIDEEIHNIPEEKFTVDKTRKVVNSRDDYLSEIINGNQNHKVRGEIESANGYNFQDPVTGTWYKSKAETGKIYEISGPINPTTIYFAYHKTLPLGSKILIEIPNNEGFVELEVINRLRKDNPGMLGLTRDCIETIFGNRRPQEATIFYLEN